MRFLAGLLVGVNHLHQLRLRKLYAVFTPGLNHIHPSFDTCAVHLVAAAVMQVSVTSSSFTGGQAPSGGAVYASGSSSLGVYGSSFASNNATWGGVLLADELSKVALDGCLLDGNTAVTAGGVLQTQKHAQVGRHQLPTSM